MSIQIILLGCIVGVTLGLTGAGGAMIAVPLLIFVLSLPMSAAAPVALLAAFIAASAGAVFGLKKKQLRYRASGLIALVGMTCAPVGVWLADKVPNNILTWLFAAVLLYTAIKMLKAPKETVSGHNTKSPESFACEINPQEGRISWNMHCARALGGIGALAGMLSGMLGVGGGFIIVPGLKKYSNVPMTQILPTSLGVIALISLVAVVSAIYLGKMNWEIGLPFAAGSLIGMSLARALAPQFSANILQSLFAILSILISIGLIVKVSLS